MPLPYRFIDLTHTLHDNIPTWDGACGFKHQTHEDYSDCDGQEKFRTMKIKMDAGIGTHMDAPSQPPRFICSTIKLFFTKCFCK